MKFADSQAKSEPMKTETKTENKPLVSFYYVFNNKGIKLDDAKLYDVEYRNAQGKCIWVLARREMGTPNVLIGNLVSGAREGRRMYQWKRLEATEYNSDSCTNNIRPHQG